MPDSGWEMTLHLAIKQGRVIQAREDDAWLDPPVATI